MVIRKFLNILQVDDNLKNNIEPRSDSEMFDYLLNLDGESYRLVKSRATLRVNILGDVYFIKKYYPIKLKEFFKNIINLNPPFNSAINEYNAILAVQNLNIKTLDIAGYGVNNKIINHASFIITRAIEPNVSLDKLLEKYLNHTDYFKLKRSLIQFIAKTTRKLHFNGLNHRDYYVCHFLIKKNTNFDILFNNNIINSELINIILDNIYLIDLHRMQIRAKLPINFIIKDLSALLFSVRNYKFTKTDYLRFIKEYNSDLFRQEKIIQKIIYRANHMREKG